MNRQRNNKTTISGSIGKAADGEDNNIHSEVLPHPNNLLFPENIVQVDEEAQDVIKLTTDQFEFLNIVGNTVRTAAAMHGNSNEAPKQIIVTESNETDISEKIGGDVEALQHMSTISEEKHIVKPDQQPVRKLRLAKRLAER